MASENTRKKKTDHNLMIEQLQEMKKFEVSLWMALKGKKLKVEYFYEDQSKLKCGRRK